MGNLIWTSILYFSTSTIVFIIYRTFVNDRKADNERKMAETTLRSQAQMKARESLQATPRQVVRRRPIAAIGAAEQEGAR